MQYCLGTIQFIQFRIPFKGYDEKWATKKLIKQYESINQYEFDPWIDFFQRSNVAKRF